jgi:hypothetical protein
VLENIDIDIACDIKKIIPGIDTNSSLKISDEEKKNIIKKLKY